MSTFSRSFHLANYIFPQGGACLEFGVFEGRTLHWMVARIEEGKLPVHVIGFDSWQGLPGEAPGVWRPERHAEGSFAAPMQKVIDQLLPLNSEAWGLQQGFYKDTLTDALRRSIVGPLMFVNIDVDIYSSTIKLLDFICPMLVPGTLLYFDDWKDPHDYNPEPWGEHRAWAEWYPRQENLEVELLESNPVNQRTMIVTTVGGVRLSHKELTDIRYHAFKLPGWSGPDK